MKPKEKEFVEFTNQSKYFALCFLHIMKNLIRLVDMYFFFVWSQNIIQNYKFDFR